MYYASNTEVLVLEIVQVRLSDELIKILEAAVKKGIYSTKSELIRDAIRSFFSEELREEILAEVIKRSKSKDFIAHERVAEELGL